MTLPNKFCYQSPCYPCPVKRVPLEKGNEDPGNEMRSIKVDRSAIRNSEGVLPFKNKGGGHWKFLKNTLQGGCYEN